MGELARRAPHLEDAPPPPSFHGPRPELKEAEQIGMTVHVSNIANSVTEEKLGSLFGAYGKVRRTRRLHAQPTHSR